MTRCMLLSEEAEDSSSNFRQVWCAHYLLRRHIMGRCCSCLGKQVVISVWFWRRPCTRRSSMDTKLRPAPIASARMAQRCVICVATASFSMAPLFPHCNAGDRGNTPTPNSTKSHTASHTHKHKHKHKHTHTHTHTRNTIFYGEQIMPNPSKVRGMHSFTPKMDLKDVMQAITLVLT
jgi:hypothetical protein